jgi:hypothetical protein
MLIDATDELPEIAKKEARQLLLDAAEALPDYALLEIRLLTPTSAQGETVFHRCNPGDGSSLNEYTGNPKRARENWRKAFRKPLEEKLQGGLQAPSGQASPIMATVQTIAVDRFSGRGNSQKPKSLLILSDLIEHGPDFTQYVGDLTFERYRKSPAYRRFRTDLQGASVTLLYVQRKTVRPLNSIEHIDFWRQWIRDNNGQFKEAVKLQGVK